MADAPLTPGPLGDGLSALLKHTTDRRKTMAGLLVGLAPGASSAASATPQAVALRPLIDAPTDAPMQLNGVIWDFVTGDYAAQGESDDLRRSARVPASRGAWVRRSDATIVSRRSDAHAVDTRLSDLSDAMPRRPEEFGAVGDGVHDDAPALQRALDAIATASAAAKGGGTRPGVLMLTQGRRYRCNSGIVLDRRLHNVTGQATLDFSGWSGVYVRVTGSLTEFGNAYGQNGCFEGQIVIVGSGGTAAGESVGILYDTPVKASATTIRTVGITVCRCDIAFRIGSRGYNQDFIACKAFECDVVFDWTAEGEDSDERTSVFGGTFFNSRLFLRHRRGAGGFYVFGCSIDYVAAVAEIDGGKAQFFGVHFESDHWSDRPFRVAGNGGAVMLHGGWILPIANKGGMTHLFEVAAGASARLRDVVTHNGQVLRTPDPATPTTWATGPGRFEMTGTEPAFEYGGFPVRQHDRSSVLADGGFDETDIQIDPVWRMADVNPIRSRDGRDAPGGGRAANNLMFARATTGQLAGSGCLRIDKTYGGGSPAMLVILAIPVRYGDKARGGFRARTVSDRAGRSRRMIVRGGFAILDGQDAAGVPIVRKFAPAGDLSIEPPTDRYVLVAPGNGASDFAAPSWATHYLIQIDLFHAHEASFLIDGRWADRF